MDLLRKTGSSQLPEAKELQPQLHFWNRNLLSVTLFEPVPILQAFGEAESQEKSGVISNQLNLWDL